MQVRFILNYMQAADLAHKRICIAANDAGGAEILSSLVRSTDNNFTISVAGPAVKIFSNKLEHFINHDIHEVCSL